MTVGQKVLQFFQTRVVRVVVLLVSIAVAVGVVRSVISIAQKRGIVAQRKAVLEKELAKHADLQQKLTEATGSAFVERVAREKLGLVKEGETVIILDKSKLQGASLSGQSNADTPAWKQWWGLFF